MSETPESKLTHAEHAIKALALEADKPGPAKAVLQLMMEATSPRTGGEFFEFMVEKIATTLGVSWVFVTECLDAPTTTVRILASWREGNTSGKVDFSLAGTPCNDVIGKGKVCFYPKDVAVLFPREKRHGQQSYVGVPILSNESGRVIGHIAIFDKQDMSNGILRDPFLIDTVLRIFSERTGAEIQRMQLARSLRQVAEDYRLTVDNQNEFVLRLDQHGLLVFVSPSFCKALDRSRTTLLGEPFSEIVQPGPAAGVLNAAQARAGAAVDSRFLTRLQTQDGWRWIDWQSRRLTQDAPSSADHTVIVGRDVTQQKLAEEKVREHTSQLAYLARRNSMNVMGTAIAHEINQPLASIKTYADACIRMLGDKKRDIDPVRDALGQISMNADRAGEIIRRLRSFVQRGESQLEPVNINLLVREVVDFMQPEISRHQIACDVQLDAPPASIRLDRIQIQQVIVNLIQNSIDAVKGRPTGIRQLHLATRRYGCTGASIIVKDSGPGISPKVAQRLFEPFVTTRPDGLGMGLSIAQTLVDAHGGTLAFQPVHPNGVQFQIDLPHD